MKFSTLTIFGIKNIKTFCVVGFDTLEQKQEFCDMSNYHRNGLDINLTLSIYRQLFDWDKNRTSYEVLDIFLNRYPYVTGFSLSEENRNIIRHTVSYARWKDSDDGNLYGLFQFIHMNLWDYETGFAINMDDMDDKTYKFFHGMIRDTTDECLEIKRRSERIGVDFSNYIETFFGL